MEPRSRLKVVFMGSPEFAVPIFEAVADAHRVVAAVTQPDRPAGRGRHLRPPPVKESALARGVPVLQPTAVRTAAHRERLAALGADVFVVAAYGRILPPAVLALPPLGCWNVHGSLLPAWRGAAPIQWSIIAGDAETGVTVMRMDEGLDTGAMALQRRTPITEEDTTQRLSVRLARLGAEAMAEALALLSEGRLLTQPQPAEGATLAPPLRKEDGRLDFREPARRVASRARGVDPWPGAHAVLRRPGASEGELPVVKLFGPRAVPARSGQPGTVLGVVDRGLLVGCGEGAVAFAELQLPGRKRLPAAAVVAGRGLQEGDRLC